MVKNFDATCGLFFTSLLALLGLGFVVGSPRNAPQGSSARNLDTHAGETSSFAMFEMMADLEGEKEAGEDEGLDDGAPSIALELGADGLSHLAGSEVSNRIIRSEGDAAEDASLVSTKEDPATEGESLLSTHDPLILLPILLVILIGLTGAAIYFKRSAEALKTKALSGSDSEDDDQSNSDMSVSFDNDNPRVMVNKQLLDRMTTISNKLKASVQQARSETTSSASSTSQKGAGVANGSRRSPVGSENRSGAAAAAAEKASLLN